MSDNLGYIENMTIGAYQLYNMFYQYCKAYDIIKSELLPIKISEPIRNNVMGTFDLMKHYEIEEDDPFKNTTLAKTYSDFINFERNNKGAVLIKVMDKSPDTAALIANHIAGLFDSIKNNMIHQRAYPDFQIKKKKLLKQSKHAAKAREEKRRLDAVANILQVRLSYFWTMKKNWRQLKMEKEREEREEEEKREALREMAEGKRKYGTDKVMKDIPVFLINV